MDGTIRIDRNGQDYLVAFIPQGSQVGTPGHVCTDLDYVLSDLKADTATTVKLMKAVERPGSSATMKVSGLSELNLRLYGLIL